MLLILANWSFKVLESKSTLYLEFSFCELKSLEHTFAFTFLLCTENDWFTQEVNGTSFYVIFSLLTFRYYLERSTSLNLLFVEILSMSKGDKSQKFSVRGFGSKILVFLGVDLHGVLV